MVKNIFCIIISLATLCSCQNSQKEKVTYVNYDNKETITQEGNSVNKGVVTQKDIEMKTIPIGFSINPFQEMTTDDVIEIVFLSDMKKILDATLRCDYQTITDKYYPDYFILLQKECPNLSIEELKDKFKNNLYRFIPQNNKRLLLEWSYAKHYDMCITSIKNKIDAGNGCLLFLYEYHTLLSSDNITIARDKPEYAIAVSLDNGVNWHSVTSTDMNEVKSLLGIRFSNNIIESLLKK